MCGCNERFPTTVESKQSKMAGCRGFGNREKYYWGELAGNRSKKSHWSRARLGFREKINPCDGKIIGHDDLRRRTFPLP